MTREEALNILHNASVYHPNYLDALNMAIKALEQESVIDKIRTEIIEEFGESDCAEECGCLYELLEIIDKHKGESEG